MAFEPGELVCLKSGGPAMTVEEISKDARTQKEMVACVWFEQVGKQQIVKRDSFIPVTLTKYEPLSSLDLL